MEKEVQGLENGESGEGVVASGLRAPARANS